MPTGTRGKAKKVTSTSSSPPSKKHKGESFSGSLRKILSERNVDLVSPTTYPHFTTLREYIESRGLTKLATDNNGFDENCVREFYEKFPPEKPKARQVLLKIRGKQINFSPAFISSFLSLPDISDDEIDKYDDAHENLSLSYLEERVLQVKDAYKSRIGHKVLQTDFPHPYKTFWQFIKRNISPHSQKSEIPTSCHKLLLLMVANSMSIPFGSIIYDAIISSKYGSCNRPLVFPCLITRICKNKKVPNMQSEDEWDKPYSQLDEVAIRRSESHSHGAQPFSPAPTPSTTPNNSSTSFFDTSSLKGADAKILAALINHRSEELRNQNIAIMARLDLMGAPPAPNSSGPTSSALIVYNEGVANHVHGDVNEDDDGGSPHA